MNFQITTTSVVNYLSFDLAFTSVAPGAGLLTVYVDGFQRGDVDEVYTLPGALNYTMPTPGDLQPGQHVVSFRLDQFSDAMSSMWVQNVATGWGGFANIADVSVEGLVNAADLGI